MAATQAHLGSMPLAVCRHEIQVQTLGHSLQHLSHTQLLLRSACLATTPQTRSSCALPTHLFMSHTRRAQGVAQPGEQPVPSGGGQERVWAGRRHIQRRARDASQRARCLGFA